ncbi:hypothetical protein ACIOD1_32905 [Streptomyces sp. NPDC088097]|uniref:hypothetical protein n=1 Tax=Streptomyces sp. NPDC088097 TaxID=3365823 RepID=UPI0037FEEB97
MVGELVVGGSVVLGGEGVEEVGWVLVAGGIKVGQQAEEGVGAGSGVGGWMGPVAGGGEVLAVVVDAAFDVGGMVGGVVTVMGVVEGDVRVMV